MPTSGHIPKPLLDAVDRRARRLNLSRNRFIVRVLERETARETDWSEEFFEQLAQVEPGDREAVDTMLSEIRGARLRRRLELILDEIGRSPWTDDVSAKFGVIKSNLERRGQRIEDFDAAIAAHALAADAVLVTANLGHMERIAGLTIQDWAADG